MWNSIITAFLDAESLQLTGSFFRILGRLASPCGFLRTAKIAQARPRLLNPNLFTLNPVFQPCRQPIVPHVVIALQRGEPRDRRGSPSRGEPGWPGGGKGPAVIHRGTDGDAGGHLIVQKPSNAPPQDRLDPRV